MKIVVVGGAGAMGAVWASCLSSTGHEVVILDVAMEALDAIDRDGLTIETADGASTVSRIPVTNRAETLGICDAAIFFTKAHHTRDAVHGALPATDPHTMVVSLQNGWGNAETLAEVVDPTQIVVGVTYQGATVLAPGQVLRTLSGGQTYLGPYVDDAPLDAAHALGDAMNVAGLPATVTADVKTEIWKKLILNGAGLPVAALTRLSTGAIGKDEALLRICEQLTIEAVAVARAKGFRVDAAERIAAIRGLIAQGGTGKASMLQDVEARRKTEAEVINGAIVREADALGIDVQLHRTMLALIRGLEASWK